MIPLKIKKLRPEAKLPTYAHPDDAGMDLFTPDSFKVEPGERKVISLGFATEFPAGYMIEIRDKSGLAAKHGIHMLGGIIDSGYRGEWQLTVLNTGRVSYPFRMGEKIAQAVVTKIENANIKEVETLADHPRGKGGHGSTGRF
jgi:dUTP pyrophosphatase